MALVIGNVELLLVEKVNVSLIIDIVSIIKVRSY